MDAEPSPVREPAAWNGPPDVTREEVLALAARGARLVETLGPDYFADAHLPGAVNVPHDRVEELAPVLLPERDRVVVVYGSDPRCHHGGSVARRLRLLGHADVRCYLGGKQDWILAGLPVERGDGGGGPGTAV